MHAEPERVAGAVARYGQRYRGSLDCSSMVDIHHDSVCAAPVSVALAYLDDYRTATSWMFGLASFDPVDGKDHGLGGSSTARSR